MSRKAPARVINSNVKNARDRRNAVGLGEPQAPKASRSGVMLLKVLIVLGILLAVAIWSSAFAAATLAWSDGVGGAIIERGIDRVRWMLK